jgi:hypothetical protein
MTFCTAGNDDIQPSYEEVTYVIKCLKNHKAPGTEQIIAGLLKTGGASVRRRNHHFIKLMWIHHKMPGEWSMGIIQPIFQRGDKLECYNYTAMTLLTKYYQVSYAID